VNPEQGQYATYLQSTQSIEHSSAAASAANANMQSMAITSTNNSQSRSTPGSVISYAICSLQSNQMQSYVTAAAADAVGSVVLIVK
jgi:hypothetical protein